MGNSECIEKAEALEKDSGQTRELNLRNLQLTLHHIIAIADVFREENNHDTNPITSISFSYNPRIGDRGATALARSLPISIREIGLVECGILDTGGRELLKWMKKSPNLTMICAQPIIGIGLLFIINEVITIIAYYFSKKYIDPNYLANPSYHE